MGSFEGVDRKCFKGKYFASIELGILKAFGNLYPNNKITIKYESEKEFYYFNVYINGETFAQQEMPMAVDTLIYVDKYINHIAIKLFSDLPEDEFYQYYDDYKVENYTWLKDEIKKVVDEYTQKGVVFEDITIQQNRWRVQCYHPEKSPKDPYYDPHRRWNSSDYKEHPELRRCSNGGYFSIIPISIATAKSTLAKFKGAAKACLDGKGR